MNKFDLEENLKKSYSETEEFLLLNGRKDYNFYFSFSTINNLIVHFHKLNDDAKLNVYNSLISYFDLIKTIPINEIKQEMRGVYLQYIETIVLKYYLKMGFKVYGTKRAYIFIYSCIFILLAIFFPLSLYPYIVVILFSSNIINSCFSDLDFNQKKEKSGLWI